MTRLARFGVSRRSRPVSSGRRRSRQYSSRVRWIKRRVLPAGSWWLFGASGERRELLARRVVSWRAGGNGYASPVLSTEAKEIYVIDAQQRDDGTRVTPVIKLDAAIGKQLRIRFEQPYVDRGNTIWSTSRWLSTRVAVC